MANGSGAWFTYNHFGDVARDLDAKIYTALEACGLQAERYAKLKCPVDTGRLRNSITHVVSGSPARTHSYTVSYRSKYDKASYDEKGKRKKVDAAVLSENTRYENIPATPKKPYTMWLGTNVQYGNIIETGAIVRGKHRPPRPYIKPALSEHASIYKAIILAYLRR